MSNQPHNLAWINENETGLAAWIRRYLTKRGKTLPRSPLKANELGGIKREIESWPTTGPEADTTWKLLRQMNEAWTQQKIRDKRRKNKLKACSFVLSTAAQKNLQQLTSANGHSTTADCLEWLLQNGGAQHKAADKERKEIKERHNEELRGKQSKIDALGLLLGHTLYEHAVSSSVTLDDGRKMHQALTEAQEGEIENTYETVRKGALARTAGLTHLSQKQMAGLIKRPSAEQIAISLANILGAEPAQPSTPTIGSSSSLEIASSKTEAQEAGTITSAQRGASPEDERVIEHAQSSTIDMSTSEDTVELPGEPEAIDHFELQRQVNAISTLINQKLRQRRQATLNLPPQPSTVFDFEGLISWDINESDN